MTDHESVPERSGLRRAWLIKIVVMFVALAGFGLWGYLDATVIYPERGRKYAEAMEHRYLEAMRARGLTTLRYDAGIEDPKAELVRLEGEEARLTQQQASTSATEGDKLRASSELARLAWFRGLETVRELEPEKTTYSEPGDAAEGVATAEARLSALAAVWQAKSPPSPLKFYDLPSQWIIMAVSWGFAVYILVLFLRVVSRTYTWDEETQRLKMPGGSSFVPEDMAEELDKRKWDKFLVFARLKDDHPLGGKELKFDTYRHSKLEEWLLDMEAEAFPDAARESAGHAVTEAEPTVEPGGAAAPAGGV